METSFLLSTLSFFTLQGGRPGIYIAPFLLKEGWTEESIGVLLLCSGIFRILVQYIVGFFIDSYPRKQKLLILGNCMVSIPCLLLYNHRSFITTMILLCLINVGEAINYPALYGITRGMTEAHQWEQVVSENETANHAGNSLFAFLAGAFSLLQADTGCFLIIVAFMGLTSSLVIIFYVPDSLINNDAASGIIRKAKADDIMNTSLSNLYKDSRILILLSVICLFHLANAAMLPLISQKLSIDNYDDDGDGGVLYTSLCILLAQVFMYLSSSNHGWLLKKLSSVESSVLLVALSCLPIRGIIISSLLFQTISGTITTSKLYALVSTQILDGIAGGLIGVVSVVIMQTYASDYVGRWSFLLSNIKVVEGVAAALSNFIGEMLAFHFNYLTSFVILSIIGVIPCVLCYFYMIQKYQGHYNGEQIKGDEIVDVNKNDINNINITHKSVVTEERQDWIRNPMLSENHRMYIDNRQ